LQASGAYIFRPNASTSFATGAPLITRVVGVGASAKAIDLVQEVTQSFGPWVSQRVRLAAGARHAEFTYTVGPIPLDDGDEASTRQTVRWRPYGSGWGWNLAPEPMRQGAEGQGCQNGTPTPIPDPTCTQVQWGKEVVSRFATGIRSGAELYTDSNGREMQRRQRDYRPSWQLQQTEPVAGNYFPVNTAVFVRDAEAQLTILTDGSQGGASLAPGRIELMVHRRLLRDDARGVGEPLNETEHASPYTGRGPNQGGAHSGRALIVRGTHYVSLEPAASAAAVWRPLMDRVYAKPLVAFAPAAGAPERSTSSALRVPLPPNLQVLTRYMRCMCTWTRTHMRMHASAHAHAHARAGGDAGAHSGRRLLAPSRAPVRAGRRPIALATCNGRLPPGISGAGLGLGSPSPPPSPPPPPFTPPSTSSASTTSNPTTSTPTTSTPTTSTPTTSTRTTYVSTRSMSPHSLPPPRCRQSRASRSSHSRPTSPR